MYSDQAATPLAPDPVAAPAALPGSCRLELFDTHSRPLRRLCIEAMLVACTPPSAETFVVHAAAAALAGGLLVWSPAATRRCCLTGTLTTCEVLHLAESVACRLQSVS